MTPRANPMATTLLVAFCATAMLSACLLKTNGGHVDEGRNAIPSPPEAVEDAPGVPEDGEASDAPEGEGDDALDTAGSEPADVGRDAEQETSGEDALVEEVDQENCDPPVSYEPHGFADANEQDLLNGTMAVVGHIIDGDTLDVLHDGLAWRIRLLGIDSPECSKEAREVHGNRRFRCVLDGAHDWYGYGAYCRAVALAADQQVRVTCDGVELGEPCTTDVYGRWLAYLELSNGRDFGEEMLAAGAAWSFTRYESSKRARYCQAEDAAIAAGAGMWRVGRDAVLDRMSSSNSNWYGNRDARCARAIDEAR